MTDRRTTETITNTDLAALYSAHCECRPLDLQRTEDEHSHDCDIAVIEDIQVALFSVEGDEADLEASRD